MRKLFFVLTILLTASLVLQFYFAAIGVFSKPEDELFTIHGTNGRMVIPLLALLTIIAAALARAGKRTIWLSVLPLVLVLFQTVLFIITGAIFNVGPESDVVPIGATIMLGFHAVNGVAILFIASVLIRRSFRLAFRTAAPAAPAAVEPAEATTAVA
jgi:hypothetical protein